MFKKLFLLLTAVFSYSWCQAQNRVSGTVADIKDGKPMEFVSVVVLKQADSSNVKGLMTGADGTFNFTAIPPGEYLLKASYIGYNPFERGRITLTESQQIDLGIVRLSAVGANVLQEVAITGTTPGIQMGIDRKVFNVEQSMVSQGGSVTDLLTNVPSLSVDMDGSVSLRGSSSVRILIDGKPSAMAGSDISQVLQSLPADAVQRIEVITNPSSRYDAEGQSGIINIVLKKNVKTGLNGSVSASAGSYNNYNTGLSLNYRDTRFNYYGNYSFRRSNMLGNGFNQTRYTANNGLIDNTSENGRKGLSHSGKLGADYFINQTTTLGVSGNFSVRDNERSEDLFYNYSGLPNFTGSSTRLTRQLEDDNGYDLNLDFKKEFKRQGEELTFNLAYGKNKEDGSQTFNQDFTDPANETDRRINDNIENGDNLNIQLDYTLPFNEKKKLEAGYRTSIGTNDESQFSQRFDPATSNFSTDYALSNTFHLEDIVHAAYLNYQSRLSKKIGFQVGLRAEQAYLNTITSVVDPSVPISQRDTPGRLDYFRVYPSLFLNYELTDEQQLQVSYTRRVNRPRGGQVNPFVDVSDPLNIRQGNPTLLPEDIHSFELGYSRSSGSSTLSSSIYYRRVNDVIQNITSRVDDGSAATVSQWQNISRNEATGIELIAKSGLGKSLDLTGNINGFYNRFGGNAAFNLPERDGFNWNANLTSDIRLTNTLTAQARANYDAPRITAQGRSIGMFVLDAALKLNVLQKKGSLMLNVRDVFNQRRFGGYTQTAEFTRDYENRRAKRMALVTFSYRFGKQTPDKERKKDREPDDDEL